MLSSFSLVSDGIDGDDDIDGVRLGRRRLCCKKQESPMKNESEELLS